MSKRSIAALGTVALAIVLSSFLLERRTTPGPIAAPTIVQVEGGDSVPVEGVPEEVVRFLREGRSWRAARALRPLLNGPDATPQMQLVAARAEANWGGWERAERILDDKPWLDEVWEGEGWFWLARARDESGDFEGALQAYDRFLEIQGDNSSRNVSVAELRRGLVMLRLGRPEEGARALQSASDETPGVDAWIELLAAEALGAAGDTSATAAFARTAPEEAGIRHRARVADVAARREVGDLRAARATALSYASAGGSAGQRAELAHTAAALALELGDTAQARRELLANLASAGTAGARESANLLLQIGGLSPDDRLAIAEVYERQGNAQRAAEGFRVWLSSGAGTADRRQQVTLALGRALFNAGSYAAAEEALRPLQSAGAAVAPEAMLLTGRSQYRRGARTQAFATFESLASRFPGSEEGSEGLFLIADLSHDDGEIERASRVYRNLASNFPGRDRAGLSLMRLGGIAFLREDYTAAAAIWQEYATAYPRGERWLEATYWTGRSLQEAGQTERAATHFRAIREREPISYYALLSMRQMGQSYWPVPLAPSPSSSYDQRRQVEEWVRVVDVLRDAGLHAEADAEAGRLAETSGDPGLLYALAEELNARGYALQGIRIGQRLESGSSQLNERLLRVLYPLPYRELIEAEATEKDLDPFLVAALTRQESLFTRRISSPVGARGLMQIMPETGEALARGVGIDSWDAELLFNPEINVHLGTRYLEEQMERYDESLPSVFSAYNAGPHRIDVWKDFPEFEDVELFTERIPYRETRNYVKILTRNLALYTALYGTAGSTPAQ